ncbi:MAG TPA: hypothetical protein VI197_24065 [Polyangiaceae bacterium]
MLSLAAASVLALGACDEQYADAVIAKPAGSSGSVSVLPDPPTGVGGADNERPDPDEGGPGTDDTLCLPCASRVDCKGRDDLCLFIGGEPRCGRACSGEHDCPSDYDCMRIGADPDDERQCVPEAGACRESPASLGEMRAYVRAVLNDVRARRGLEPLRGSACLDEIGQDAVAELVLEGTVNTKFNRECANYIPYCDCDWRQESQAFVNLDSITWEDAVEHPFERAAQSDPDGAFFRNVVSDDWERVGIGVLLDDDYLRISLEFGP